MDSEIIKNYILNYCYDYLTKKEIMGYWFFTTLIVGIYFVVSYVTDVSMAFFVIPGLLISTIWSALLLLSNKKRQSIKMHPMYLSCGIIFCFLVSLIILAQALIIFEQSLFLLLPILTLAVSTGVLAIIRIRQNIATSKRNKNDIANDSANDTASLKGITAGTIGGIFGGLGFLLMVILPVPSEMYSQILFFSTVFFNAFFSFCGGIHIYRLYLIKKYCPDIDDYKTSP